MKKLFFLITTLVIMSIFSLVKAFDNECIGSISLTFNSNFVEEGEKIKAMAAGLTGRECQNKIIHIRLDSCYGERGCLCKIKESGCSCTFNVPSISTEYKHFFKEYRYFACVDKNGDLDYKDPGEASYTTLTVKKRIISLPLGILQALINFLRDISGMFTQTFKLKYI